MFALTAFMSGTSYGMLNYKHEMPHIHSRPCHFIVQVSNLNPATAFVRVMKVNLWPRTGNRKVLKASLVGKVEPETFSLTFMANDELQTLCLW